MSSEVHHSRQYPLPIVFTSTFHQYSTPVLFTSTPLPRRLCDRAPTRIALVPSRIRCTKHELGTKSQGTDLATQYLAFRLWGLTPKDNPEVWKNNREKINQRKYMGQVLHRLVSNFGTIVFFVLPVNAPSL